MKSEPDCMIIGYELLIVFLYHIVLLLKYILYLFLVELGVIFFAVFFNNILGKNT